MSRPDALRSPFGVEPNFGGSWAYLEGITLGRADEQLVSESWTQIPDVALETRDGLQLVTVVALEQLREDLALLEAAFDSPPAGFEAGDGRGGALVWRFPEGDEGRRLADAAARLSDFGALADAGIEAR